ncbi:MAG: type II CAAX endopeptidase family protein [Candidatus Sericytochromatia bacterium]|nr:type II CAAX endopeptidase family protein [Candidatus Sericytochromatia bacterium]
MTPPVPPVIPLGRAAGVWLASLGLMGAVSLAFYYQGPQQGMEPWFFATVAIVAVLLPSVVACYWPRPEAPGRLPLYLAPSRALIGAALGVSLPLYVLSAAVLVLLGDGKAVGGLPQGFSAAPSTLALTGLWLAYALLPAVAEELLYRGMIQPAVTARWGPAWGIGITALLFAGTHLEAAGVAPRLLMGLWFGWLAWRSGSLWASTWAHAWNNTWAVLYFLVGQAWVASHPWLVGGAAAVGLLGALGLLHREGALGLPPHPWRQGLAWRTPRLSWRGIARRERPETAAQVAVQRLVALRARQAGPSRDGADPDEDLAKG